MQASDAGNFFPEYLNILLEYGEEILLLKFKTRQGLRRKTVYKQTHQEQQLILWCGTGTELIDPFPFSFVFIYS